ncbi:hypothetical protein ACH5RR_006197 [Cinchona calisaya]|uniref:Ultraviolet-B-repressible protein n=1 Tax=Cinchona calisaya TaxID=153742 RepID=A0ABD3ANC5_9GENT
MASTSAVFMATPLTYASQKPQLNADTFFKPLPVKPSNAIAATKPTAKFQVKASSSLKEKAVTGLTAAALTAAVMIPDVAEAADSGISPSLQNFLLSILAGGTVLALLGGAVIAVSNFDPVKRS